MSSLDRWITNAAIFGVVVSAVIAYLKVNKLWARKHIRDVAESISVAAALLSLLTTLPFLLKFVVVDHDYVAAAKFALSLIVFFVFFFVGIGFWVRDEDSAGLWQKLKQALSTERGELANLVHSFTKPKEANAIVRILRLVATVDRNLDEREIEILQSVSGPWGLDPGELEQFRGESDIQQVRQAFMDYLALSPPKRQVKKVFDLVRFIVRADKKVTHEEHLILEEVSRAVDGYLDDDGREGLVYEVLVVPQSPEHLKTIPEHLDTPDLYPRAGGEAFVAGCYYSPLFAEEVCRRYRELNFFATVEPQQVVT
jgi:hypothetical protein